MKQPSLTDSSGSCEVKLWCFKGGELARFDDASSPVFTSDDEYLLYAACGKSIEVFCLKTMQGKEDACFWQGEAVAQW